MERSIRVALYDTPDFPGRNDSCAIVYLAHAFSLLGSDAFIPGGCIEQDSIGCIAVGAENKDSGRLQALQVDHENERVLS